MMKFMRYCTAAVMPQHRATSSKNSSGLLVNRAILLIVTAGTDRGATIPKNQYDLDCVPFRALSKNAPQRTMMLFMTAKNQNMSQRCSSVQLLALSRAEKTMKVITTEVMTRTAPGKYCLKIMDLPPRQVIVVGKIVTYTVIFVNIKTPHRLWCFLVVEFIYCAATIALMLY